MYQSWFSYNPKISENWKISGWNSPIASKFGGNIPKGDCKLSVRVELITSFSENDVCVYIFWLLSLFWFTWWSLPIPKSQILRKVMCQIISKCGICLDMVEPTSNFTLFHLFLLYLEVIFHFFPGTITQSIIYSLKWSFRFSNNSNFSRRSLIALKICTNICMDSKKVFTNFHWRIPFCLKP